MPENISDEEDVTIGIKIDGELGQFVMEGEEAMKIYEIVWQFLNRAKSN